MLTLLVGEFVGDGFSLSWGFEVFSIDGSFCLQHHQERKRKRKRERERERERVINLGGEQEMKE